MRDKPVRPENILLMLRNYHDLERRSPHIVTDQQHGEGPFGVKVVVVTTHTTLTGEHDLVLVDCTYGEITITVPAAADHPFKQYRIKKIDTSLHKVRVIFYSNEELDDETEWYITFHNDCMNFISDGVSEWFMV